MARAKRLYIPGYVWHITHRCHKQEFLLKFARDRNRWMDWLFEAKKRYRLTVLDYTITSNHIHLLVSDDSGNRNVIPKSMQLIAGRTAQEYNQRKNRKGAFWEDRYHATAIENNQHLVQCMTYIELNMVRAGVVGHPSEWKWCGYNEIQEPKQRYRIIDYHQLMRLSGFDDYEIFRKAHFNWIAESVKTDFIEKDQKWSKGVAIGSRQFVEEIKNRLKGRVKGRQVLKTTGNSFELRETQAPYQTNISTKP